MQLEASEKMQVKCKVIAIFPCTYRPKKKTQALAHSRRQRENDTFTDIAQALPIQENAKDLDKASILRLAIHYLKLRDLIRDGNEEEEGAEELDGELREDAEELVRQVEELSPSTKSSEEPSDAVLQSKWTSRGQRVTLY